MHATLNGKDVLSAHIREPRIGAWTAEVDVDSDDAITGSVTLALGFDSWQGTIVRGSLETGRFHAIVVGGAGGLSKQLPPKHYISSPMRMMLGEILKAIGETQSAAMDAAVGNTFMDRWSRFGGSGGQALKQVAQDLGVSWRVLRDGSIWLGVETWPELKVEHDIIERLPGRGRALIAPDVFTLRPGVRWEGQQLSEVHTLLSEGAFRQELVFEDATVGALDKSLQTLSNVVDGLVGRRVDLSNQYPAVCASDSAADGTVDVIADDPRVRGTGISRVAVRPGLPGTTVRLRAGSRVTLYFEDNDVNKPAASMWQSGAGALEILIEADTQLTLQAPTVRVVGDLEVTGEVTANADTAPTNLSLHKHPSAMGPTGAPVPGT
jgi:hypothetical protein